MVDPSGISATARSKLLKTLFSTLGTPNPYVFGIMDVDCGQRPRELWKLVLVYIETKAVPTEEPRDSYLDLPTLVRLSVRVNASPALTRGIDPRQPSIYTGPAGLAMRLGPGD